MYIFIYLFIINNILYTNVYKILNNRIMYILFLQEKLVNKFIYYFILINY